MKQTRLKVGLVGLGRLGTVYARSLAGQIPHTELSAVSDIDATRLDAIADELQVTRRHPDPAALIDDPQVEAVVIVTPTDTHQTLVEAAASASKPVFCEKPLSISLAEANAMQQTVEATGIFFQMGFMRRFDRGYASAKTKVDEGQIGSPVVFKSSSRDPYLPSLDYLKTSGGIFVDMGIHDFDLALWFFGPIQAVSSIGGVLAYPEVEPIGDVDNAIVSLTFTDGRVGVVDLSRNGVYGYGIETEILGTGGAVRVGYLRETPLLVMTPNSIAHDTVPYFMERFGESYTRQLSNFAENLLQDRPPPITLRDGLEALRVATAATASYKTQQRVVVETAGHGGHGGSS